MEKNVSFSVHVPGIYILVHRPQVWRMCTEESFIRWLLLYQAEALSSAISSALSGRVLH